METKITGLTHFNVRALREVGVAEVEAGQMVLTTSTASWDGTALSWARWLTATMASLPTRGHPRASLHAVLRKVSALADEESRDVAAPDERPAKKDRAVQHATDSVEAAQRILTALSKGRKPKLADAKILEAAGCYIRRNAVGGRS